MSIDVMIGIAAFEPIGIVVASRWRAILRLDAEADDDRPPPMPGL